jgi:hypothetical protein
MKYIIYSIVIICTINVKAALVQANDLIRLMGSPLSP